MNRISKMAVALLGFVPGGVGLGGAAFSQESKQADKLNFYYDYARFRYADSLMFVEFSASMERHQLKYVPHDKKYRGEFIVTAELVEQDSIIDRKLWRNVNEVDSLAELGQGQSIYCLNSFVVPDRPCQIRLQIQDPQNPQGTGMVEWPIPFKPFDSDSLRLSDLQMASTIERDTVQSVFSKNGFRVTPNPMALYGIGLPILYTYLEVYNLAPATSELGAKYRIEYKVLNSEGGLVKTFGVKERKKPGTSAVEVNAANVVTLVSGAYFLLAEVTDLENNAVSQVKHKFFVYREADYAEGGEKFQKKEEVQQAGSAGLDVGRYEAMGEKEINEEFEYARYIAEKQERDTYKKLNLEGKRKYIKEFWAKRDQTPGTPENEFKQDYLARVQYANHSLRGTFREGWRTDRGRVILIYGRADEIERFPFNNQNRSYEIWHYYQVQGGVDFIFVDKREMGDYELVHSTARGELYDAEWTRWIDPNSDSSTSGTMY